MLLASEQLSMPELARLELAFLTFGTRSLGHVSRPLEPRVRPVEGLSLPRADAGSACTSMPPLDDASDTDSDADEEEGPDAASGFPDGEVLHALHFGQRTTPAEAQTTRLGLRLQLQRLRDSHHLATGGANEWADLLSRQP